METIVQSITEQTRRALWEIRNVIDCVPDAMWEKPYCEMPVWKHIYHTLHSLDRWFINPCDPAYLEPAIHREGLNDLDRPTDGLLTRAQLEGYLADIERKLARYLSSLTDAMLTQAPEGCPFSRMTLILGQHRHLHSHMGMLMGFIIAETGLWPRVLGLEGDFPQGEYEKYF